MLFSSKQKKSKKNENYHANYGLKVQRFQAPSKEEFKILLKTVKLQKIGLIFRRYKLWIRRPLITSMDF